MKLEELAQMVSRALRERGEVDVVVDGTAVTVSDDTQFAEWMKRVDDALYDALGVSSRDLPDQCYRDFFLQGMEPSEVLEIVAEEEDVDWLDE